MKKDIRLIITFLLSSFSLLAQQENGEWNNLIEMESNGKRLTISLYDNPTARDFASKLPMTIYMGNHKQVTLIGELKDSLVVSDSIQSIVAKTKELVYYPQLNELRYNYDTHVINLSVQPLGYVKSNRRIFDDVTDGVDVTFRIKE